MTLLKKNKYKLLLPTSILFVFLITFILSKVIPSLVFFNLIPIAILLGFGCTIFFIDIFSIKNILTFLVISLFLGLFFNTLVIFFLATFGLNIGLQFFTYYLPIVLLLNLGLFFRRGKEKDIKSYVKNLKIELIDIFWITVFILLFVLLTSACLELFTPSWDSFTFWALDSKYIFENSSLRDNSFLLLANSYMSFYPIQLHYVYLLYGKIVEQYASLLSITYAFIGVSLITSYLIDIKKNSIKKLLIYIGILAAITTFFVTHYVIISIYADLFLSVIILFYALVLFNGKYSVQNYWKRFLILTFFSVTLYFTKTHYFPLSFFLLAFYFLYDFKFLYTNFKEIKKNPFFLTSIFFLFSYLLFIIKLSPYVSNEKEFVAFVNERVFIDSPIFTNIKNMIKQLLSKAPFFVMSLFVNIVLAIFVKRGLKSKDLPRILFVSLLISFVLFLYIFKILDISDLSMLRYLGLVFFACPFLFIEILPNLKIDILWQKIVIIFVFSLLPFLVLFQIYKETEFDFNFTPHSGSYKDFDDSYNQLGVSKYFLATGKYYKLSEQVLNLIPKDSKLIVLDSVEYQNRVSNIFLPGLYLKYFLFYINKGGPYSCFPDKCFDFFLSLRPDYLLINEYDEYWKECEGVLEKDKTYLVKFSKINETHLEWNCIVSPEDIVYTF